VEESVESAHPTLVAIINTITIPIVYLSTGKRIGGGRSPAKRVCEDEIRCYQGKKQRIFSVLVLLGERYFLNCCVFKLL
jgi:hypothetical protein